MKNNEIKHIDFFSGPGGICTGFQAAGINTLLAVEKVKSCVDTYSRNHPNVKVLNKDIRNVSMDDVKDYIGKVDIITSGMPCETFSTAGSSSRSFYDHRQQLYYETIRLANILKPQLILFENVPGILSKKTIKNGSRFVIDDIFDDLSAIGYKYYIQTTLYASDFGVPQNRQRFFIIATSNKDIKLKVPIAKHNGKVTVNDAFFDLPKIEANQTKEPKTYLKKECEYTKLMRDEYFWKRGNKSTDVLSYHIAPKHRKGTLERFKLIEQGENLKDIFDKLSEQEIKKLQEQKVLPKKWFIQRNMRLKPNEPSKTVTSHCLDELVHPVIDRALTVREVARLQSFPDYYDFIGGPFICPHLYETQDKYEQIGDAVPPLLAYHWGLVIKEILETKK
jgi:DNA (cytosine-5)-methyltransferase 1